MKNKFKIALLILIALFASSANGEPIAYSVNSDSGNVLTMDSLYQIDLASGYDQQRGERSESHVDTEGLAIAPNGVLWGIDDSSRSLFPINPISGSVRSQDEITLAGFAIGGKDDFGMTFSCDNSLYITSVRFKTLYQLYMDGSSRIIGAEGAIGQNISAIAATGSPTRLYGIGNGQFENGTTDAPNLYSISLDPDSKDSGVAKLIGPLGPEAGPYGQAGLAFDKDGVLWAITDRRIVDGKIAELPSQILRIDVETGKATLVSSTIDEVGFESLAIAAPTDCSPSTNAEEDDLPVIPTLDAAGRLLAMFVLLLTGAIVLRRRYS